MLQGHGPGTRGTPPAGPPAVTLSQSITDSSTIQGSIPWTATPSDVARTSQIDFYIDNVLKWTEHYSPYTYNGDPGGLLDCSTLTAASHAFKVIATLTDTTTVTNTVNATVVHPPTHTFEYGAYKGYGNASGLSTMRTWKGGPTDFGYAMDFLDGTSWSSLSGSAADLKSKWTGSGRKVVMSVPMIANGATMSAANSGTYDANYTAIANALNGYSPGPMVIRLGWECNGTYVNGSGQTVGWFIWNFTDNASAQVYGSVFRRIVGLFKAVNSGFTFEWNINCGSNQTLAVTAYPGDSYVDYIGGDIYDGSWTYSDPTQRWNEHLTKSCGLNWLSSFAAQHGKPPVISEYGLEGPPSSAPYQGDNSVFLPNMHDWGAANNCAYQLYFEFNASDGTHSLEGGTFPLGAASYKTAYA